MKVNMSQIPGSSRLNSVEAHTKDMDRILGQIQECRWSLGTFLKDLFADSEDGLGYLLKKTHMVLRFLGGHTGVLVENIVEMIYKH